MINFIQTTESYKQFLIMLFNDLVRRVLDEVSEHSRIQHVYN